MAYLSDTWAALGRADSALWYQQRAYQLQADMREERERAIARQTDYSLNLAEQEYDLLRQEHALQERARLTQRLLVGLVIAGLLVLALVLYQRYQRSQHQQQIAQTFHQADRRVGDAIVQIYQEEKVALVEERNQLGRILHESIQGQIAISKMLIQNVEAAILSADGSLAEQLDLIKSTLQSSNDRVRSMSHRLKDGKPYHETYEGRLLDDFHRIIQPYRSTSLFDQLTLHTDFVPEDLQMQGLYLSGQLRNDLLLWVQGALTNVVKHSQARSVNISLAHAGEDLHLTVHDNGMGIDPRWQERAGPQSGLLGLQGEVEAHGGQLSVINQQGTKLHIQVPLSRLTPPSLLAPET